jgi:hypothetical protein
LCFHICGLHPRILIQTSFPRKYNDSHTSVFEITAESFKCG